MKYVTIAARILLGLPFLVLGLNYFLQFKDMGGPAEAEAQRFMAALMETGYMMPLIKGTETVCGALLVLGLFVPLALTVLAPVLINIALFHVFLSQPGIPFAAALVALELFLAWQYRASFAALLNPMARSSASRLASSGR